MVPQLVTMASGKIPITRKRILWVDLLRLLASFQMVHGHTLDALMAEELRTGQLFRTWSWSRGLVSVSFMVAAGVAFSLSTLDRFEKHRTHPAVIRKRLLRIGWLIVLGYLLHFPSNLFAGSAAAAASLRDFQIVDVLQCIGMSVLLLQLLTFTLKSRTQVLFAAAGLSGVFLCGAPFLDAVPADGSVLPRALANYLTHSGGSLFPLFPWAGFVLFGVALAGFALPNGVDTKPQQSMWRLLVAAGTVLTLSFVLQQFPLSDSSTNYQARTWFALSKLGWVLCVVSALAAVSIRLRSLPRVLQILSGESLILYVFHLMVLYGAGIGLYRVIGRTLPLPIAIVVAGLMVVTTGTVGVLWHRAKKAMRRKPSQPTAALASHG